MKTVLTESQLRNIISKTIAEALKSSDSESICNLVKESEPDEEYYDDDGLIEETDYIQLTEEDYRYAFEQVYGKQPDDIEELVEYYDLPYDDIEITQHSYCYYEGTFEAGPEYDEGYDGWEVSDETYYLIKEKTPQVRKLIITAIRHHMQGQPEYDSSTLDNLLKGRFNESRLNNIISEAIKKYAKSEKA